MTETNNGNWITRVERWLWQAELTEASSFTRRLWHAARVVFAVIRDLIDGHITLYAMSLVYTTLLSLVPFLALSFSVLKGFGVHNQLEPALEQFLVAPLGPERGHIVVENIINFVDNVKVGVLGSVGLALLVYTVISLVQKIEFSFNEIWCINRARSWTQRFSSYLSVIVIGPLLVFAALGATAAVVNADVVQRVSEVDEVAWLFAFIGRLVPYVVVIMLFTFLYLLIPNTKVKFKYALAGGVVAGIIWQTAGFAFTIFAASSTNYDAIYSGFAVGIMLLIWLYLAWLILLVGASVAYYAQHARQISRSRVSAPSAALDEYTGLALMYRVAKKFDEEGGSSFISEIENDLSVGAGTVKRIMEKLVKHKLLVASGLEEQELLPGRPLDKITLRQLLQVLRMPEETIPISRSGHSAVTEVMNKVDLTLADVLDDVTVAEWIRPANHELSLGS